MGQHNAEWLGSPDCNFKPFNFIRQSPLDLAGPTADLDTVASYSQMFSEADRH